MGQFKYLTVLALDVLSVPLVARLRETLSVQAPFWQEVEFVVAGEQKGLMMYYNWSVARDLFVKTWLYFILTYF